MAWAIYRSTDAGAPVLSGTAGALVTVLNYVLGLAGWSRPFSGSSTKMVYRAGSGTRAYFRILDDGSLGIGAMGASARGYMDMTDVDTGTDLFPTTAQIPSGRLICKSENNNSTAVPWIIAADDRTVMIFTYLAGVGRYQSHYLGDLYSFMTGDAYNAVIICPTASYASDGFMTECISDVVYPFDVDDNAGNTNAASPTCTDFPNELKYIARSYTQTGTSIGGCLIQTSNLCTFSALGIKWGYFLGRTNPPDSGVYLSEFHFAHTPYAVRGKLRGIWMMHHRPSTWTAGETFEGTGKLLGRRFEVMKLYPPKGGVGPIPDAVLVALETTDTVDQ